MLLIRPMISPSLYWTRQWLFPGVLRLLVCHRQVPTPTNTPTKKPLFWDGDSQVTQDTKRVIIYWSKCYIFFLCSITEINSPSSSLLQARVDLVSNLECRDDPDFGKYVSDGSVCVSSADVFTCAVRK